LTADRVRRAAVLLLPVLLVVAGLEARRLAARALRSFIHYQTPFGVPPVEARTGEPLSRQVVLVLVDGLSLQGSRGVSPLMALPAWLAALRPVPNTPLAPTAEPAGEVV
jgi:hypothetical protein